MKEYSEQGNPDQENYPPSLDGEYASWWQALEADEGWQSEQQENQDE